MQGNSRANPSATAAPWPRIAFAAPAIDVAPPNPRWRLVRRIAIAVFAVAVLYYPLGMLMISRVNDDLSWIAPVLRLIRAYLDAGIMRDGVISERYQGTPQGGPPQCRFGLRFLSR